MTAKGSVLVAMSGGVDSSVAACLLAEQGYEVLGSHMNLVHLDGVEHGCCGPRARADAAEVARLAGFDFEIVDMSSVFERTVLADFFSEHEAGRTPNPCARCNEQIKFGAFLERADELGIDFVATGHYVRTELDAGGGWHLYRGADRSKDQSYMLHMLGQAELARSMFPVGGMEKARDQAPCRTVRSPGRRPSPIHRRCASSREPITPRSFGSTPRRWCAAARSSILRGRVLASHDGTFGFTVGQRRGLGVSGPEPSYVLELDAPKNRVVVGPKELLCAPRARRGPRLVDRGRAAGGGRVQGRGPDPLPGRGRCRRWCARTVRSAIHVDFDRPQRGVAPGQSVVVSRGDELLGGGRIIEARSSDGAG